MRNEIVEKCRVFAIENHKKVNQLYGGLPYDTHLQEVVSFVYKFKDELTEEEFILALCVAWCHDLKEDTGLSYSKIKQKTSEQIADNVWLLSNLEKNRVSQKYYDAIISNKISLFVKLCDRLANTSHSLIYGSDEHLKMYNKEFPHFKSSLSDGRFNNMWEEFNKLTPTKTTIYTGIDKFDEISVCRIKLPKPIPFSLYGELYQKGIIRKKDLIKNRYYKGDCRNANVALWNGYEFLYNRYKFGSTFIEDIKHLEDDNGYDLFIPYQLIDYNDVTEQNKIKY